MKIEFLLFIILGIILLNIYYDGKIFEFLKKFNQYEKYYKMIFIIFIFFCIYLYLKKNPNNKKEFFKSASGYIKYLPVDRKVTSSLEPFIEMMSKTNENNLSNNINYDNNLTKQQSRLLTSGRNSNKRSVSETKKKYIAANQNWKCKHCSKQLPAWFEVDHVTKLEYGGSNSIDNLEALCRDCHGKKTALENL
tara:strand:- start:15499 stop:16077 length:579 start_codon:yes stop_codon:yes gene_type:complete